MRVEIARDKVPQLSGMALVATGIISKFLGAIYRIPLTNILGAEGIGMYQMVFPIYALMLTLSSSGIPTAISRLVSERNAIGDKDGIVRIVKTSAILLTALGALFMLILFAISAPLAHLQGNDYLSVAYYAIAPAVIIVAGSSIFKGYFQGMMNLMPTAVTGLIEQVVKMGVGLLLASLLLRYGIVYAVTGAVLGLTCAELVSFFIMFIIYWRHRNAKTSIHLYNFREDSEDILRVSLPIAMTGIIFPLMQVIDSMLIVNILSGIGVESDKATAMYGLLMGPVGTLINMPIVVTLALAIMIVPSISMSRMRREVDAVKAKCVTSVKLSFIVGVPASLGLFVMAEVIMRVLYPTLSESEILLGADLLRVSSVSVILLSLVQIFTAMLEALDKTKVGMYSLIMAGVVKVIASIFLIRQLGIVGASIASILTYLLVVLLDSIYLRYYLGSSDDLVRSTAKVLLSGLVMAGIVLLVTRYIDNIYASLVVAILLGVAIYALFMLSWKVMTDDELASLPLGRLLVHVERKLRFWERKNDRDNRTGNN